LMTIIRNPVYTGRAAYGRRRRLTKTRSQARPESEWLTTAVPPLVTPQEAQAALDGIARRRRQGVARTPDADPYELRGWLVCGHCGGQIAVRSRTGRPRGYCCVRTFPYAAARQHTARCTLPSLRAEAVEAALWGRVAAILLDPQQLTDGLAAAQAEHAAEH